MNAKKSASTAGCWLGGSQVDARKTLIAAKERKEVKYPQRQPYSRSFVSIAVDPLSASICGSGLLEVEIGHSL
jgi:hypothetical protein